MLFLGRILNSRAQAVVSVGFVLGLFSPASAQPVSSVQSIGPFYPRSSFSVVPFAPFGPYNGERFGGYRIDGWNGYGVDITSWGANSGATWGAGFVNPFAAGAEPLASSAGVQSVLRVPSQTVEGGNRPTRPKLIEFKKRPVTVAPSSAPGVENTTVLIPSDKLFAADGHVRWPAAAPDVENLAGLRQAADSAVQAAVQAFQKSGKASIHDVVEARNKLALFAAPALEKLREDSPADAAGLELFLQSLDRALNSMADPSPR